MPNAVAIFDIEYFFYLKYIGKVIDLEENKLKD